MKTPKELDIIFTEGHRQGEVDLGIYTLDRDTLRICRGKTRPEEFKSVAGTGNLLHYYIRVSPLTSLPPGGDITKAEFQRFQGVWAIKSKGLSKNNLNVQCQRLGVIV